MMMMNQVNPDAGRCASGDVTVIGTVATSNVAMSPACVAYDDDAATQRNVSGSLFLHIGHSF